jgi:hypothetical protein
VSPLHPVCNVVVDEGNETHTWCSFDHRCETVSGNTPALRQAWQTSGGDGLDVEDAVKILFCYQTYIVYIIAGEHVVRNSPAQC